MFNWEDGKLLISLPELGWWHWFVLLGIINGVYGLITHYHSLPQVNRYNAEVESKRRAMLSEVANKYRPKIYSDDKIRTINSFCDRAMLKPADLFASLLYRTTVNLFARICCVPIGICAALALFVATGKMQSNDILRWAWRWHLTPERLALNLGRSLLDDKE